MRFIKLPKQPLSLVNIGGTFYEVPSVYKKLGKARVLRAWQENRLVKASNRLIATLRE